MFDDAAPLFVQIAAQLADEIADGNLAEGDRVPSSNELAVFHRINPATAAKGITVLLDQGLLEKRRGVGMFVVAGARMNLLAARRKDFTEQYLRPLLAEAQRLGIDADALVAMIRNASATQPDPATPSAAQPRSHEVGTHAIGGPPQ